MDREFGTRSQLFTENKKSVGTRLDFSLAKVSNQIIVDAEITSFDNFANEIKRKDQNFNYHFSRLEVEKLYNLLCFQELKNQDDEEAKYNPANYEEIEDINKNVYEKFYNKKQYSGIENEKKFIRTRGEVYLLDTKSGITAKSQETVDKSNALQN
ncbi:14521_t:CDS:2 [Entrophospora sp. SA101]|nr:14521_t:CDS:2 [Entrophospora sp. SA101]